MGLPRKNSNEEEKCNKRKERRKNKISRSDKRQTIEAFKERNEL
jgi:hypothetical protein